MLKQSKRTESISIIAIFLVLIKIVVIAFITYSVVMLIIHPEIIGEFLGKIMKGFNTIK